MKPLIYILPSLVAGVLLQVLCGGFRPSVLAFPLNAAVILALLATLWVVEGECGEKAAVRTFRSARMACGLLIAIGLWCILGGLTPQMPLPDDATSLHHLAAFLGLNKFPTSYPFVLLLLLLLLLLSLVIIHRLRKKIWRRDVPFLLLHGGLWLALVGGMAGSADAVEGRIVVARQAPTRSAYDAYGREITLPYTLQLTDFHVTRHEADQSPVQYDATLLVDDTPQSLAVNSPCSVRLFEYLYLLNYFSENDADQADAVLLLMVRNPWKPAVLGGILLLLLGTGWQLFRLK
ncbi:MAG: cytochrome c biogenesis protein ResB [Alloprevotella sp.]